MKSKVAEKSASIPEAHAECSMPSAQDAAAAIAGVAGGVAGAVIGGTVGSTNEAAVAAAAVGVTLGVLAAEAVTAREERSQAESMAQVVDYLQKHLGAMTTSYLSGADNPAVVGSWAEGKSHPEEVAALRLRTAGEATRYLVKAYGDTAARSWFLGTNDLLDRESPAYILRHGQRPDDWAYVIPAARQFVENAR